MSPHLIPSPALLLRRFLFPFRPRCRQPPAVPAHQLAHTTPEQLITINVLPDDVLIQIFDFYLNPLHGGRRVERWKLLAQVCRRWRSVVFESPRRLNLRLVCSPRTHARNMDIWPPYPLIISDVDDMYDDERRGVDNIIAALEHNDRVRQIELINSELGYVTDSAAMQKPFPELTHLRLGLGEFGFKSILPNSFLGGAAPRLQSLYLYQVPFPGLPKLLLSATNLVYFYLHDIPTSGHIPPDAMATSLSALTNLALLHLHFCSPRPRLAPDTRHPPTLKRSMLPSLTMIDFKGTSEYLEVILARIDTPRLNELQIVFFNQIIFDTPQLFQFIRRRPTPRAPEKAHIVFNSKVVIVKFSSQTSNNDVLCVKIPCTTSEWQLSSLEQVYNSSLPLFPRWKTSTSSKIK